MKNFMPIIIHDFLFLGSLNHELLLRNNDALIMLEDMDERG